MKLKYSKKMFQILIAFILMISSCFAVNSVEAAAPGVDSALNNGMLISKNDVIDDNTFNDDEAPTFVKDDGTTGSEQINGNEGLIWTNKKVKKGSEDGQFVVTLSAVGYKYRMVDKNDNRTNTWKNPIEQDTQLSITETIPTDYSLVDDSVKVVKWNGLNNNNNFYSSSDNQFAISFNEDDIISTGKISFDVQVQFTVEYTGNPVINTDYPTGTATSKFIPAGDNYYYYTWGVTKSQYGLEGVNWDANVDLKGIVDIESFDLFDSKGDLIENVHFNKSIWKDTGDYPDGIEDQYGNTHSYERVNVFETLGNTDSTVIELKSKGFKNLYIYLDKEKGENLYIQIEIIYDDDTSRILIPSVIELSKTESNDGNREFVAFETVIKKDDAKLREEFILDEQGYIVKEFDNHGVIAFSKITADNLKQDKTATLIDWDERTYQIDLYAAHNIKEVNKTADIIMMLDFSGSMPWFVDRPTGGTTKLHRIQSEDRNKETIYKNKEGNLLEQWDYKYYVQRQGEGDAQEYKPIVYCKPDWYDTGSSEEEYLEAGWYIVKSKSTGEKVIDVNTTSRKTTVLDGEDIYIRGDNDQTKLEALYTAISYFVDNLEAVSPDSKVAILTFAGDVKPKESSIKFEDVSSINIDEYFSGIYPLRGNTNQGYAMNVAASFLKDNGYSKDNTYGLLFTDGDYSKSYDIDGDNDKESFGDDYHFKYAENLRINHVNTLFTAGIFGDTTCSGATNLEKWATDESCVYIEDTANDLINAFSDIFGRITVQISGVSVVDYIDSRFVLIDENGTELQPGDSFAGGIIDLDEDKNQYYITWDDVNLSYAEDVKTGWHQTIYIKAKENYIGGNDIPTNGENSGITVADDIFVEFDKPHVNVKVDFVVGNKEDTIFLGETIPSSSISDLFDENKVYNSKGVQLTIAPDGTNLDESDFDLTWFTKVGNNKYLVVDSSKIDNFSTLRPTSKQVYYLQVELKNIEATDENSETEQNTKGYDNTEGVYLLATNDRDTINDNIYLSDGNKTLYSTQSKYGVYVVDVVSGSITINKNIDGNIADPNTQGDSIFTFLVEGETVSGKKIHEYKVIRFDTNDIQSFTIDGLEKGTYTITELDSIRYDLESLVIDDSTNVVFATVDKQVTFYVGQTSGTDKTTNINATNGEATYTNKLINDESIGDTDVVTNSFEVRDDGSVIIKKDNYKVSQD
ncbi:hypothetical protein F300043A5_07750 [Massilimicrobiota timonensis]|uniref:vWA domain-containing protein n=1 Tax=Massilimicrobiota timonensis TaxID=1776392 RepID=UPI0036F2961C